MCKNKRREYCADIVKQTRQFDKPRKSFVVKYVSVKFWINFKDCNCIDHPVRDHSTSKVPFRIFTVLFIIFQAKTCKENSGTCGSPLPQRGLSQLGSFSGVYTCIHWVVICIYDSSTWIGD